MKNVNYKNPSLSWTYRQRIKVSAHLHTWSTQYCRTFFVICIQNLGYTLLGGGNDHLARWLYVAALFGWQDPCKYLVADYKDQKSKKNVPSLRVLDCKKGSRSWTIIKKSYLEQSADKSFGWVSESILIIDAEIFIGWFSQINYS